MKNVGNVPKEERCYFITYFRAQECIHYLHIFVFSVYVAMDNLLPTLKPPAVTDVLHLPEVNRKTRNENSQQILENIGYGLGVTP